MECALVPVTGDSGIPRERQNDGDDGKSGGGTNCMERGRTLSAACVKQRLLGGGSSKSTALRRGSQGSAGSPARRSARGRRARLVFEHGDFVARCDLIGRRIPKQAEALSAYGMGQETVARDETPGCNNAQAGAAKRSGLRERSATWAVQDSNL